MDKTTDTVGKAALGVEGTCRYLGDIGRATLYRLPIPHLKIGKRRLYLITDLDKYLQGQLVEAR